MSCELTICLVESHDLSSGIATFPTEKSILCASHPEHNGVVFLGFGMPEFIKFGGVIGRHVVFHVGLVA